MSEEDRSQLSFLAHALVRRPKLFAQYARELLDTKSASCSKEFKHAVEVLLEQAQQVKRERDPNFEKMAKELLNRNDDAEKAAGRAMAWAFETSNAKR